MKISGSTALMTGANRGLGRHFAQQLLDRGASKVYATARLTNGIRLELAKQGTLVTGLFLGATDTDMTAGYDLQKIDPADIVRSALDGLEAGRFEILADQDSVQAKAALSLDPSIAFHDQLVAART